MLLGQSNRRGQRCAQNCTGTAWTSPRARTWKGRFAHIREAYIAVNEQSEIRAVPEPSEQLARELNKHRQLCGT